MNRIVCIATSLLLLLTVAVSAHASAPQSVESENPAGIWNVVVVVPDIEAAVRCAGGEWINAVDLAKSDRPDGAYSGLKLPYAGALFVLKPEALDNIVKDATQFIIDWKAAGYDEFKALEFSEILTVARCGDLVLVTTRPAGISRYIAADGLSDLEAVRSCAATMTSDR